jgi:hypothetical protein
MIDDPWPDKKVLLPDNDAIDIIENLFIRLMRVVEGGTENSNGKKYNDAYMTSQQSIYTSTKLTLITYINGLISQLTLINESEDDFDWVKETNPIQCKDLKGYYFYYGTDPRKFIINDISIKNPRGYGRGDELKVHYKWYDQHSNKDDWGQFKCDTFIHRVKLGSYNLYDTDDKEVNQRDLTYTDNTFDDDVRKEIWEQGELDWVKDESDDLQWIRDIKPYIPFEEAKVGHHYNINITNVDGFNKALDDCEELFDIDRVVQAKVLLGSMEQYHSIYCYDNDFIPYWPSKKFSLNLKLLDGNGKRLLSHWFASGDLIQLQEQ